MLHESGQHCNKFKLLTPQERSLNSARQQGITTTRGSHIHLAQVGDTNTLHVPYFLFRSLKSSSSSRGNSREIICMGRMGETCMVHLGCERSRNANPRMHDREYEHAHVEQCMRVGSRSGVLEGTCMGACVSVNVCIRATALRTKANRQVPPHATTHANGHNEPRRPKTRKPETRPQGVGMCAHECGSMHDHMQVGTSRCQQGFTPRALATCTCCERCACCTTIKITAADVDMEKLKRRAVALSLG